MEISLWSAVENYTVWCSSTDARCFALKVSFCMVYSLNTTNHAKTGSFFVPKRPFIPTCHFGDFLCLKWLSLPCNYNLKQSSYEKNKSSATPSPSSSRSRGCISVKGRCTRTNREKVNNRNQTTVHWICRDAKFCVSTTEAFGTTITNQKTDRAKR